MAIINFNLNNGTINKASQSKQEITPNKAENASSATDSRATTSDSVALTESAKQIQSLEEKLKLLPIVDTEKVSEIKDNLDNGSYQISPETIAYKFTQYEALLQDAG